MSNQERAPLTTESHPGLDRIEHGLLMDLTDTDFNNVIIDGRIILQGKEGELLGYNVMYESVFVNNWLSQFAIDVVNGHCYFDMNGWSELTNTLVEGMIIVDDSTNQPLFVIPSFTRPLMSPEVSAQLSYVSNKASEAKHIVDQYEQTRYIMEYARVACEIMDGEKEVYGRTKLIPAEFYRKHDVVPDALKAMIYIRDFYKVDPNSDTFTKIDRIINNHYRGKPVTAQERQLVFEVTEGTFTFGETNHSQTTEAVKPAPSLKVTLSPFDD